MRIEEVREILKEVSFAPSNLDMGWEWDIKYSKIYDDNNIVIEKGFSVRTTFMRPDIGSGEMEKGYGRWMYIPENVSMDGLVKTAWVCAELIVKHELMEAFLYNRKKIFDPHKSLKDLQHNSRVVEKPPIKDIDKDKENKTKGDVIPTQEVVKAASKQVESDVRKPKVVRDDIIKLDKDKGTVSSKEIFHKQNLGNHSQEISDYLKGNLKKERSNSKEVEKYSVLTYMVYNNTTDGVTTLADLNDKVIDVRGNEDYNLSSVKEMLGEIIVESNLADSAVVNHRIHDSGFTEGKNVDDVWIFSNPNIKTRYIVHSEIDKSFAVINQENDIVNLDGKPMVYEGDNYNMENLEKILNVVKK